VTTYKLADSVQFMALAADAAAKGYNRQLDLNELAKILDPLSISLCTFSMIHEHIAGQRVAPHMRTLWLVKLRDKPVTDLKALSLDISMENFNALPESENVEKATK
jgi:hypothetical protein